MLTRTHVAFLLLLSSTLCLIPASPAQAQYGTNCGECDPYTSFCSDECWYCAGDYPPDETCPEDGVRYSTCGAHGYLSTGLNGCLLDNCTSSWQQTSSVTVGTYGEAIYGYSGGITYACYHHSVNNVTFTDSNQCNRESEYWTQSFCNDTVDGYKGPARPNYPVDMSWFEQDCCDGTSYAGGYGTTDWTCNHFHSCS
jgi:hypothetical protein